MKKLVLLTVLLGAMMFTEDELTKLRIIGRIVDKRITEANVETKIAKGQDPGMQVRSSVVVTFDVPTAKLIRDTIKLAIQSSDPPLKEGPIGEVLPIEGKE